jgi:hypothetical protein
VFIAVMLFAGNLAAQQVLMAPSVDLSFDSVQVTGQTDDVAVDYRIDQNDWTWAKDFGMDVWMGVYTPQATGEPTGQWQLQQAERLSAPQGAVGFEDAISSGTGQFGLCLVVANVDGGEIAPGMGYVCETPLVVSGTFGRVDLERTDASVALRFERHVEQQPWFTAQRGFDQATATAGTVQAEGPFFSYRAPSPPEEVQTEADRRSYDRHTRDRHTRNKTDQRRRDDHGYLIYGGGAYVPGLTTGTFGRDRFTVDRFRQRRLRQRRMFGPIGGFDASFDQDLFETHPEDVFYNYPITPGYFGRDAFGRDLRRGFGVPPGHQKMLHPRGFGQPFD